MPNNYFKFKQFTVYQDKTAMKVGTDGVLLGAWAKINNAKTILDIGSGTGLISLMLAQCSDAKIIGIDIDKDAFLQATENFKQSKWGDRLDSVNTSIQDYTKTNNSKFDLIVSNPPYFVNSLKSTNKKRTKARHTDTLSFKELIENVNCLLSEKGSFAVIIPSLSEKEFCDITKNNKLYCNRKTYIKPIERKEINRVLLQFSREKTELLKDELIIEISRHNYTQKYINLTKDFYLNL